MSGWLGSVDYDVEIGALNPRRAGIRPIKLPGRYVESHEVRGHDAGQDVLDAHAVQICALQAVSIVVGPIELAARRVDGDAGGKLQPRRDEILDIDPRHERSAVGTIRPVKHGISRIRALRSGGGAI